MDILQALSKQKEKPSVEERPGKIMPDGLWSISDAVFNSTLYRLGVDVKTVIECMAEPVESRPWYLNYFEGKNERKKA